MEGLVIPKTYWTQKNPRDCSKTCVQLILPGFQLVDNQKEINLCGLSAARQALPARPASWQEGSQEELQELLLPSPLSFRFLPTNSRQELGSMNDFKYQIEFNVYHKDGLVNYEGKTFCYLWIDKKTKNPYIGIVDGGLIEHPLLELGNRKRMKALPIDPEEDFPLEAMEQIFGEALKICANRGK